MLIAPFPGSLLIRGEVILARCVVHGNFPCFWETRLVSGPADQFHTRRRPQKAGPGW